jgi:hypothetical protein
MRIIDDNGPGITIESLKAAKRWLDRAVTDDYQPRFVVAENFRGWVSPPFNRGKYGEIQTPLDS